VVDIAAGTVANDFESVYDESSRTHFKCMIGPAADTGFDWKGIHP
jgi:hypothetical protein